MPNPQRRPAAPARREGTPASEIDGSDQGEVHGGVGGGLGSTSGPDSAHLPAGPPAAVHGGAQALAAQLGSGMATAWPGGPGAGPTSFPAAWVGAPPSTAGAAVNPGGAATVGCLPDWWNSAATLGPEWLASVLAAATTPASTSTGMQPSGQERLEVPVQGGPSRRRGGRTSRAARPPAPIRATQPTPASIDLTDPV
ncbi:unnamed protein product [Urochloa humidicola]